MAKDESNSRSTPAPASADVPPQKTPNFFDTWPATAFLIVVIFFLRFQVWEPFKIPSGSMEPTLIGHEDYGDRIVTNKLAYMPPLWAALTLVGSALFIAIGAIASKSWMRWRSLVQTAIIFLLIPGGIGFYWIKGAVAGEPQRFDVVVFNYHANWGFGKTNDSKINYIKRLIGLPGETIAVSGGDIFLRSKDGTNHILRKWETSKELQDSLWYPVSKAWAPTAFKDATPADIARLKFPWNGAEQGKSGVKLTEKSLELDGTAPVEIAYAYPVTNVYVKQGRWPFKHVNCPAAHLPGIEADGGAVVKNPNETPEKMTYYISNTWEGIQCKHCNRVLFPVMIDSTVVNRELAVTNFKEEPEFRPLGNLGNFFYGGDYVVGDVKVDLELNIEGAGGSMQIDAGNNLHRAIWQIPSERRDRDESEDAHYVWAPVPALGVGKHTLSLAYVDATVIAVLDGAEIERRKIEVKLPGPPGFSMKNIISVSFKGVKGSVTTLNLSRDLFHTPALVNSLQMSLKQDGNARFYEDADGNRLPPNHPTFEDTDGNKYSTADVATPSSHSDWYYGTFVARIPQGKYLMMGDNSPSSSDGRVWGFVPREDLAGRASFVWWPPSRWKLIK